MKGTTFISKEAFRCPACRQPVTMRVACEVGPIDGMNSDDGTVSTTVRMIGVHITHDCTTKAKRS